MGTSSNIRVVFVGLSGRGGGLARKTASMGYDVVAGADVDADVRTSFQDEYDAMTYDDPEQLFDEVDPDAAVVATPNAYHAPVAIAALTAGVNVLVEKPLADSLDAARAVADAEAGSTAFGMVGFQRRFLNQMQTLNAEIETGRLGEVTHIEVNYARRRGIPRGAKVIEEHGGGGALLDLGVHVLDLALYFLSFPQLDEAVGTTRSDFMNRDDVVSRWSGPPAEQTAVEDTARGVLRTEAGTTVAVHASWAQHQPTDHRIRIWGTEGGASCELHGNAITFYEDRLTGTGQLVDSTASVEENDATEAELEYFFESVRTGEPPTLNTIEQGVAVQRAIDGIYRSAAKGAAVSVADPVTR